MNVLSVILTINTHLTFILSVIPNMALIYLSFTSRVPEIRGFRVIIAAQSITEILTAVEMSLTEMVTYIQRCSLLNCIFAKLCTQ